VKHPFKRGARYNKGPKEKRTADGILFDSIKECERYKELKLLQEQGVIVFFLRQVPFDLPGGIKWRCDFLVFWADGEVSVEDVKGHATEMYKLKKRQVEQLYPVTIMEL
jgi:hypothetical protein